MADFGGGLASFLGGIFNDPSEAFERGREAFGPWYDRAAGEYGPYSEFGKRGIGKYEDWLNGMANPSDFINHLMGQYQESPWARFSKDQAMRAGMNAASAGGTLGSTPFANEMAEQAAGISSKDMQNWLANVLGINTQYGAGWGNAINAGMNAAGGRSNVFQNRGNMEGGAAYGAEAARQQRWNDILAGLGNMGMAAGQAYAGGGFF